MTNILKARIKREGVKRVYRCGIVRCPEVLASHEHGGLLAVTPGYAPNREGIFIKTRRAGSRIKHQRQYAEDCVKPLWLEAQLEADALQHKKICEETKDLPADVSQEIYIDTVLKIDTAKEDAKENAARRYYTAALHSREDMFGFMPDKDDWPLTIRCARCGYLSKIEWTP